MSDDERFRRIKLLFGTLDDLGQERKKVWTEWVGGRLDASAFGGLMRTNLARTHQAAADLEGLLGP